MPHSKGALNINNTDDDCDDNNNDDNYSLNTLAFFSHSTKYELSLRSLV